MTQPPSPLTMLLSRHTRRREFITLLGGTAAAWPLVAHAQQSVMPVIGFMHQQSLAGTPCTCLKRFGAVSRRAVLARARTSRSSSAGRAVDYSKLPALAADLVSSPGAVLVAAGGPSSAARSKTPPRQYRSSSECGGDPVSDGFVESFNRPGGNVTGLTLLSTELLGKRLELL